MHDEHQHVLGRVLRRVRLPWLHYKKVRAQRDLPGEIEVLTGAFLQGRGQYFFGKQFGRANRVE